MFQKIDIKNTSRKSLDTKQNSKRISSSEDDSKKKPFQAASHKNLSKAPAVGGKVPPSVIKQMQTPISNNKNVVKPSVGMKAAAQQKQQKNKTNSSKDKKKTSKSSTSDSEEEKKPVPSSVKNRRPSATPKKRRGRPPKNTQPVKVPTSSSSSTDTESTDSDTETSTEKTSMKDQSKVKQTRSSRKSKHVFGKFNTETESDSTRRSFSKSPKRINSKLINKEIKHEKSPLTPEKRECPLDGCDSSGHLSGNHERHFTIESCPLYHNISSCEIKNLCVERKKRDEERKRALETFDRNKKLQTAEQKLYSQKIRESRAKFKSPTPSLKESSKSIVDKQREPSIKGFAPEYDYQLFRQAQAAASELIENEMKLLPVSRGTKYITMGRNLMQVWYQSPYPEDVARLPKLYLCEFCLRYQKCAIGMKRHAAKCVWRHPPGNEIYRKGKLGVWQIDGKRHKQYCQHLCLVYLMKAKKKR